MSDKRRAGRRCTVCKHRKTAEIEKAVIGRFDAKARIAERHGLHPDAINRHMRNHVSEERKKEILLEIKREKSAAIDAEINQDTVDIKEGLQWIVREIDGILRRAKAAGDDTLALTSLRDMRQTLMDMARIYGQLQQITTVNVNVADLPQWQQLKAILVEVFRLHPSAGETFLTKTGHLRLIEERPEWTTPSVN
jgi:hypothetical protein